ncbi:MAG: response regulator [Gammaproteobacteria bacterium]
MNRITPIKILLVEDDPADQKLIKMSLRNQEITSELCVVNNAEEALDFLCSRGSYSDQTTPPDLILLDLNMPGMGGKEFLKHIKLNEDLKQIPVVVVTTSNADRDVIDSYKLQAAGYIHKPTTVDEFKRVMGEIGDYWFMLCNLPNRGH